DEERINYSFGASGSTSLFDAGLGNGGGRYKAKIKALGMVLAN
ncbi:unnamed protein product, partial [Rotaria sp. Silwood2]